MATQVNSPKHETALAEAHNAVQMGRHAEAEKHYRRVLRDRPSHAEANMGLGIVLKSQGRLADAEGPLRRAATMAANSAEAHYQLGEILRFQNKLTEAEAALQRSLAIDPNSPNTVSSMGLTVAAKGQLAESFPWFERHAEMVYGNGHISDEPIPLHKVQHDQEQRDYLASTSHLRKDKLGSKVEGPAISSESRDYIAQLWKENSPQYVVIDNFLTPAALDALRQFCWGSNAWRGFHADGYAKALPEHGFVCPLLAQIDEELHSVHPTILEQLPLLYWWGFKYDGKKRGTAIHADFAAVNINLWIAPDEANLDPTSGGLIIWDKPAPLEWGFAEYNGPTHLAREFLAKTGAKSVTVPHRANRAVVFNSNLFHETDKISFADGYLNRRINITMLYGWRGEGAARRV